jgi:chorismate mutase
VTHPCTACAATVGDCDATIRDTGHGCCDTCFTHDTHGLLDDVPASVDVSLQVQVANLTRIVAQMVIARHEHAQAIGRLRASEGANIEQLARINGIVDDLARRLRLVEIAVTTGPLTELRQAVVDIDQMDDEMEALEDRVVIIERCLEAIEAKLKLKRRKQPLALGTGS